MHPRLTALCFLHALKQVSITDSHAHCNSDVLLPEHQQQGGAGAQDNSMVPLHCIAAGQQCGTPENQISPGKAGSGCPAAVLGVQEAKTSSLLLPG